MNYILMEIKDNDNNWGLMYSENRSYILSVANDIILQGSNLIQVWETEEDPDIFLSANIIFSRNTNTGESFRLYSCPDGKYQIFNNNTKEYIIGKNKDGFLWGHDYTFGIHFDISKAETIIKEFTT